MIDELVRDALAAQTAPVEVEPTVQTWARIGEAGRLAIRRRRRSVGAMAVAVVVVAAIVAFGVGQGSPSSEKVATTPTTATVGPSAAARQIAPPPAPSVAEPLWQASRPQPGFSVVSWAAGGSWTAARTAGDGLELVLTTSGCGDRFGAVVQDLGNRVSVQLAVADGPHLSCLMTEQVHVRLANALDGRPLVDGPAGAPGPVLDGATLVVPHRLPAGMRFQTEGLYADGGFGSIGATESASMRWEACYQADLPPSGSGEKAANAVQRCVFTGDRPMVSTTQVAWPGGSDQALNDGVLAQDSIHLVPNGPTIAGTGGGVAYVSGPSSPRPGRALVRTSVAGGVDGHSADLVSTGLHDVVVWTDGRSWFSVATPHGVGGVTPAELVRIAQSMRPVS